MFGYLRLGSMLAATVAALAPVSLSADPSPDMVQPVTKFVGEMAVPMPGGGIEIGDVGNALRFEPLQNFEEMFQRDDVVFLMRHGPTNWDKLDVRNVAPDNCDDQRILSEEGREDMRDMGALLAFNDIRPGKIVVSQWCRNQQTYEMLAEGYDSAKPGVFRFIPHETSADINLLLSLQGAPNVTELRRMVTEWDGEGADGPLLIISHFTNIQEFTQFNVYEGEALVVDPKRNNRVLGYVRLKTAGPDVGHFDIGAEQAIYNDDGTLREESVAPRSGLDPVALE